MRIAYGNAVIAALGLLALSAAAAAPVAWHGDRDASLTPVSSTAPAVSIVDDLEPERSCSANVQLPAARALIACSDTAVPAARSTAPNDPLADAPKTSPPA